MLPHRFHSAALPAFALYSQILLRIWNFGPANRGRHKDNFVVALFLPADPMEPDDQLQVFGQAAWLESPSFDDAVPPEQPKRAGNKQQRIHITERHAAS